MPTQIKYRGDDFGAATLHSYTNSKKRFTERINIMAEDGKDAVSRAVDAMVRLESILKGRESQVAVIIVTAMSDLLKERGEAGIAQ